MGRARTAAIVLAALGGLGLGCDRQAPVLPRDPGCIVKHVTDGDTIAVTGCMDARIRLLLVDAPEVDSGSTPGECFGEESRAYLQSRLPPGTEVWLERGVLDRDRFDRPLRYVWLGDELINESLVAGGYAVRYRDAEDDTYRDRVAAAETRAKEAGLGLWSACR